MAPPGCLERYKRSRVQVKFSNVVEGFKERLADYIPASMVLPLFSIITVGLIFAVVGPVFVAYQRTTGKSTSGTSVYCGLGLMQEPGTILACKEYDQVTSQMNVTEKPLVVFLKSRFTSLDLQAGTITLVTDIVTYGDIGNDQGELKVPQGVNLTVIIGSQTANFQAGDRPDRVSTSLDLKAEKSLFQYPFDKYTSSINYKVFLCVGNTMTVFVPAIAQLDTGLPSFTIQADESSSRHVQITNNVTQVFTSVQLERSIATKFFSIFIVIAMWALSASTLVFVVDLVYVRPQEIATDDLAFVAGVLFALPGVRNVQPGVPDGGASVDVLGYFWNMAIVVFSACLALAGMMGQFIVQNKEDLLIHGDADSDSGRGHGKRHHRHEHAPLKVTVEPENML